MVVSAPAPPQGEPRPPKDPTLPNVVRVDRVNEYKCAVKPQPTHVMFVRIGQTGSNAMRDWMVDSMRWLPGMSRNGGKKAITPTNCKQEHFALQLSACVTFRMSLKTYLSGQKLRLSQTSRW